MTLMEENFLHYIWSCSLLIFVVSFLTISLFYHMIYNPEYRPGHKTLPFIWYQFISTMYKNSQRMPNLSAAYNSQPLYGLCKIFEKQKIFSFSIMGKEYVFLFTPEYMEVILSSSKLIAKSSDYGKVTPMMKDGLFMSKGQKWRNRRRLLTPAFHFKILQGYASLMKGISDDVTREIQESINEPYIDGDILCKRISHYILMKTSFGLSVDSEEVNVEVFNAMQAYVMCFHRRLVRPWLYPNFIYKFSSLAKESAGYCETVHSYIKKKIEEKKKELRIHGQNNIKNESKTNGHIPVSNGIQKIECVSESKKKHKSFLDLLMELHMKDNTFSEKDVFEECISFFVGGVFSTGSALTFALYGIALNKDVQQRLHEELDEMVGETNRDLTEEDISQWKYLECVIKESLRLFGPSYFSREALEDTKIGDYTIKKGSVIVLFYGLIHTDPTVYPNPEKFDPSHFYPENCIGRNPYAFLPFSAGPRNCIGQKFAMLEMKTVLSTIIRWFDVEALDDVDHLNDIKRLYKEEGIPVRVKFTLRKNMKSIPS